MDKIIIGTEAFKEFKNTQIRSIFLIGAKGCKNYGGYESFVDKLTEYHQEYKGIKYYVACKANGQGYMDEGTLEGVTAISEYEFIYHNAHCFKIHVPNVGSAQAIFYDVKALQWVCNYIKKKKLENFIVYVMACRVGPFSRYFQNEIHKLGGKLYLNPDGHEWKRAKWSAPIRAYWKWSEELMIKHCDLAICDSKNIEKYIQKTYKKYSPITTYIAYGAEITKSKLSDKAPKYVEWMKKFELTGRMYYLVVGRFVPENNYETMIREYMKSCSKKDFVIISNVNRKFLDELEKRLHFLQDKRIKFVGTVYDQELLRKIRENAYGYIHGHEVGGTNPSLLEALSSTKLNLLLNVEFNRECGEDGALYWNKTEGNLGALINRTDAFTEEEIKELSEKAQKRIKNFYSWDFIANEYKDSFINKDFQ